ncbi:putative cyclase/dehydrase [Candidatus Nitrososphaera gargensis Ga9.2]|uniref:Putative cyclase/dehydrase n=1 Tax=Nitrososphaera gargensis (strain Ga9.2) TaxID=1237085 RepID=K0IL22_NITGG|nr:SRPBCC family protein [Candidatus Nitrososphaera gargensis]AFU59272.1 putative cyclase/dehydrase [Candidatus Nitrososphaera gargensis Ga9.2]
MRTFRHTFTVNAGIDKVWDFYTDINHLQVISPPGMQIRLVKTTHQKLIEGSEVWLTGILLTRSSWHSKITSLAPYRYVDEMLSGRFHVWKHVHGFRKVDGNNNTATEVIDEIDFELHYGMLGRIFEGYVYSQLEKIFAYRKQATIKALEKNI